MQTQGFRCLEEGERKVLETPGLRVVLEWRDDRWTHAIELALAGAGGWVRVADALDGEADPGRVIGPVYQEFHWQEGSAGGLGMLIGKSGPHHSSAVFAARWVTAEGRFDFEVELADRCRATVASLAATYLVQLDSGHLADARADEIAWSGERLAGGRLAFSTTGGPDSVALAEAGRRSARVQALAKLDPTTATHRLRYGWRWMPEGSASKRASEQQT